ncbi:MAG: hypothetical protein R3D28_22470 [Geminicoccaceae bacterium]
MRALGSVVMDAGRFMAASPAASPEATDAAFSYCRMVAETPGSDTLGAAGFPARASASMSALLIQRIVAACPNAVMLATTGPGSTFSAVRDAEAEGARRISILTGNGGIFLPFELARG